MAAKKIQRKIHLFDAKDKVLGRFAVEVARTLSGKAKVDYTPHIDGGDAVVVVNANRVHLTGNKEQKKIYYHHTGFPGGIKDVSAKDLREKDARQLIFSAVHGMLPKNKLGRAMEKRLHVFNDDQHDKKIDVTHK